MDESKLELEQLLEQRALRDKLIARIGRSEARVKERRRALRGLKGTLDKEHADVRKLEGLSLEAI